MVARGRSGFSPLTRFYPGSKPGRCRAGRQADSCFCAAKQDHPLIGRPVIDIDLPKLRDFFIPFGRGGYWVRYTVTDDEIIIVRIWSSREDRIIL